LIAWSGGVTIEDFIKVSKEGRANGDFIMHRENGTLVDLNLAKGRAVGKMKAIITQRFTIKGVQCDVDCDVRFIFCLKVGNDWKCKYYKRHVRLLSYFIWGIPSSCNMLESDISSPAARPTH
jgi:hypothetical protein